MVGDLKKKIRAAVVGYPVKHSLSPVIHNEWAYREGIDGHYEAIEITPEDFPTRIKELAKTGYAGVNVTMPHKVAALELADFVTPAAMLAGAANMLTFNGLHIHADNSDITGFEKALLTVIRSLSGNKKYQLDRALVLGAGGAANGIVIALIQAGFQKITITNRTAEKAKALAKKFQEHFPRATIKSSPWEQRNLQSTDIVVNTTSLGMVGMPSLDFTVNPDRGHRIIADIVYNPLITPLLKEAQQKGLPIIDGLSMLMHQAVPGYQAWLGEKAEVDIALRTLLENKLQENKESSMLTIGLTGSIGMGKSTAAKMFADLGCAIWDADAAVHRLYDDDGIAVEPVGKAFPEVVMSGKVDREKLSTILQECPQRIKELEAIVHPLVALDRMQFLEDQKQLGTQICVLDIPILFENAAQDQFDAVVVVSAGEEIQRKRVLSRPGMTEEKFTIILARQMPDKEKRKRADYVINTEGPLDETRQQVINILEKIKASSN